MKITKTDERKMKDYLSNRNGKLNIYFLSNDLNKCHEISNSKIKDTISIDNRNNLTYLKNKTSYELQTYDLIVVSNNNYSISFKEQLRTLTNKLAIENNKNMMAVYHYDIEFKDEDEIIFFFETPNFESINTIQIEKMKLDTLKLLDLVAYKFDEKNQNIDSKKKILTLK